MRFKINPCFSSKPDTCTLEPIGKSEGERTSFRNPDTLKGAPSTLKTTHAYKPASVNPSGATV